MGTLNGQVRISWQMRFLKGLAVLPILSEALVLLTQKLLGSILIWGAVTQTANQIHLGFGSIQVGKQPIMLIALSFATNQIKRARAARPPQRAMSVSVVWEI